MEWQIFIVCTIFLLIPVDGADLWEYYLGEYEDIVEYSTVLATGSKIRKFKEKQSNRLTITYPEDLGPQGGEVKGGYFRVGMSNDRGRLIITEGGIGKHILEVIVEAELSSFIECNYTIYGSEPFRRATRVRNRAKEPI